MHHLRTTLQVIEALGGYHAVATLTGRTPNAAENWKRHLAFPADTYLVMTDALSDKGFSAPPSLWKMRQPKRDVAAE